MSIFTPDTSIQITGDSSLTKTYNTKDNPNLAFHSRAGIYNSANNEIKFFTNNIDALTIDANQKVICNGSLITNIAWGNIDGKPSFFDGTWTSLSGKPTNFQSDWLTTITNKPSLFDGTWTSLSGKPTLFDGTWTSLSGKPTNFQSDWLTTITNKPSLFDGTWTSLSGKPTLFDGTWTSLSGKPTLFDGTWTSLSGKPTLFDGTWTSLSGKPTLFDGNYNSLTNKPFISSGIDVFTNNQGNTTIGNDTSITAVNGTIYQVINDYTSNYCVFLQSGSITFPRNTICDIFMIGGGGGGGAGFGGGGGAGAYYLGTNINLTAGNYTITVGAGGQGQQNITVDNGVNGGNTIIALGSTTILTVNGGAKGAGYVNSTIGLSGKDGGCGSGGAAYYSGQPTNTAVSGGLAVNIGTNGTGFNGGTGYSVEGTANLQGGGGGGIGGNGGNAVARGSGATGAKGGDGLVINITGTGSVYGGGGAGGVWGEQGNITVGIGGGAILNTIFTKVGGDGGLRSDTADRDGKHAVANTGSGGGGASGGFSKGGNGSAGIVIIRYKVPNLIVKNNLAVSGELILENGSIINKTTGRSLILGTENTERMRILNNGNVGINVSAPNVYAKLQVNGVVNFHNGNPSAVPNNNMSSGSLTIGGIDVNYGNGSGWNTNVAGLLLECANNTEIAVHDASERIASLINFVGGANNYHEYGRNMGGGHPNGHYFKCNNVFECFFNNAASGWNYFKVEPTSLWGDGLSTASDQNGTKYLTMRNLMFQNPHVVPASVGGNALIRMGRAGGVSSGNFWDVATRTDGRFHIVRNGDAFSSSMVIKPNGNVSFANQNSYDDPTAPTLYQFLHLGNSTTANVCDWNLVIHKSNGSGSTRHFAMGYDNSFYETIGDNGANNTGSGSWMSHLSMSYAAPDYGLQLFTNGNFQVYGTISSSSDIKIKKNVRTIDNALWKVQQLRGVYYTHIIEGTKNIGLIAQEVEGIIPEVVSYNERTDMKGVNYANLTALLINAVKEQQEIIEAQNDRINKIEELLYNLISKEDAI